MDKFWLKDNSSDKYQNYGKNLCSFTKNKLSNKRIVSILDFGCGSGEVVYEFFLKNPLVNRLNAYDFSVSAIKKAKKLFKQYNIQKDFDSRDILKYHNDLIDNFDLVICTEVIEHLHNPTQAVLSLINYIAPGGSLILAVPDGRLDRSTKHINFWSEASWSTFINSTIEKVRNKKFNATHCMKDLNNKGYKNNISIIIRNS